VVHALRRPGRRTRGEDGRGTGERRRAAPDSAGLPRGARSAVRLLHAGDDARQRRAARAEPGPDGGGDPLGALREHLPLHGLPEHRQVGAVGREQAEGDVMTAVETEHKGWLGRSVKRKEDARFIRGRGNYIEDINLPGMLYMAILRSPYAHAKINS